MLRKIVFRHDWNSIVLIDFRMCSCPSHAVVTTSRNQRAWNGYVWRYTKIWYDLPMRNQYWWTKIDGSNKIMHWTGEFGNMPMAEYSANVCIKYNSSLSMFFDYFAKKFYVYSDSSSCSGKYKIYSTFEDI